MKLSNKSAAAVAAAALASLVGVSGYAQALNPVTDLGLFNTGVDASGNALPDNEVDPHYTVPVNANSPGSTTAYATAPLPSPPWVSNTATSRWITPQPSDPTIAAGEYVYQTSFDVPAALDLSALRIFGQVAADNVISNLGITVNGQNIGTVNHAALGTHFSRYRNLGINNRFLQHGTNTIQFKTTNGGVDPGGIHVRFTGADLSTASDGLFASDSFDYPTGRLSGSTSNAGGVGWASPWAHRADGTLGSGFVAGPGLAYPGMTTSGATAHAKQASEGGTSQTFRALDMDRIPARYLSPDGAIGAAGESVWFAVLAQRNTDQPTGFNGIGTFLLPNPSDPFNPTQGLTDSPQLLEQTYVGVASNSTDWRMAGSQPASTLVKPADSVEGSVDLLVVRVDFRWDPNDPEPQPDRALMWINPLLSGEAPDDSLAAATNVARAAIPHLHFNTIRVAGSGDFGGFYDEFRLGSDFNFVTDAPSEWGVASGGDYSVSGNWTAGTPSGAGIVAKFGAAISSPQVINVDGPQVIGGLAFQNSNTYTVSGSGITLDRPRGEVGIVVSQGSHTVSAPVTLAKSAFVAADEGSKVTLSNLSAASGVSLTKVGGGILEVNNARVDALKINGGRVRITPNGAAAGVSNVAALTIAEGATLDLSDNKLVTTTAPGTATAGVYDGLQREVQRAYNFTSWDQPGLTTSMPAAKQGLTTIGISTGAQIRGLADTATDLWAGQTITGASTLAMYTYAGDANLDGQIDAGDYGIIDNFVQIAGANGYGNGDFNYDGFIDAGDYGIIDNNVQAQTAPFSTTGDISGVTAVPEPGACGLLAASACAFLARRRRSAAPA